MARGGLRLEPRLWCVHSDVPHWPGSHTRTPPLLGCWHGFGGCPVQNEILSRRWLTLPCVLNPAEPRKTCPGLLLSCSSGSWPCRTGTTPSPPGRPGGPGVCGVVEPPAWVSPGCGLAAPPHCSLGLGLSEWELGLSEGCRRPHVSATCPAAPAFPCLGALGRMCAASGNPGFVVA